MAKSKTSNNNKKNKKDIKKSVGRPFPKVSLEKSLIVPQVLKEKNGGNPWTPDQVANALDFGKGNNFYYLTASSRDYGLTEGTRDAKKIELDTIGRQIVYASSKKEEIEGYKSAFFNIDVFQDVYEYYDGGNLPELEYLKNTLKTEFDVSENYHDQFYKVFTENMAFLRKNSDLGMEDKNTLQKNEKSHGSNAIVVGEPSKGSKKIAFVAMPFSEKTNLYPKNFFDEVLKHLITPSAVEAGFKVETARKQGSDVIQSTIVKELMNADLVICDLTEHNPNVLFELGLRMAFEKPVALIRATGTTPIFDVDHMLRVFDYSPNLWQSTLENDIPKLKEHIEGTWDNRQKEKSYLNILKASNAS